MQSSPSSSHSLRHSSNFNPYLLSCWQRLLFEQRQDLPVRHSYSCPLEAARSKVASTAAKTFIFGFPEVYGTHDTAQDARFLTLCQFTRAKPSYPGPKMKPPQQGAAGDLQRYPRIFFGRTKDRRSSVKGPRRKIQRSQAAKSEPQAKSCQAQAAKANH